VIRDDRTRNYVTSRETPPEEALKATSRMLRAGWHPIQIKALTILTERVASPKEIAVALRLTSAKAGYVSYHVKELVNHGLVELVRTEARRGVDEHFYRAAKPLIVMDDEAECMSFEERFAFSGWIIRCMNGDFAMAIESRTIDARTDRHLSRFPLHLDEKAYRDLVGEQNSVFHRTLEIAAGSRERLDESGEEGMPVAALMAVFPLPLRSNQADRSGLQVSSRETPPKDVLKATRKMLRAGWHPIQIRALTILTERVASPKEIAVALRLTSAKAGYVSYHVKELLTRGLIELVRTEPRRGANEHFYRAAKPLIVMDDEAERMSFEERLAFSCWIICCINGDFAMAVETGTIDTRIDRHLSRFPLELDEEGYLDLVSEHNDLFYRTLEIASESTERMEESAEEGMPVAALLAVIPMPPPVDS
jgi:predicted transcriptional regulator